MPKKKIKELDICPFCGSDAELIPIDERLFCVRCTECNATTEYLGTEQGARASWNDRRRYHEKRFCLLLLETLSVSVVAGVIFGVILGIVSCFM